MCSDWIAIILMEPTGCGSFSQEVSLGHGRLAHHRFSLATGLGSLHDRYRYRTFFGTRVPSWLDGLHPHHVRRLCSDAIKRGSALPGDFRWQGHVNA